MKNLTKFKCKCGKVVTVMAAMNHFGGQKCSAGPEYKKYIMDLILKWRKNKCAWLKREGEEAKRNKYWAADVINNIYKKDDFTFTSPRLKGVNPPSTYQKMSQARKAMMNPMVRARKKDYNIEKIKQFAKESLTNIIAGDGVFSDIKLILDQKYPDWSYDLAYIGDKKGGGGLRKQNQKLSFLLDISLEEMVQIKRALRGKKISQGLIKSQKFKEAASKHASTLLSKFRVTKPQLILFKMIQSIDKTSKMEYPVQINGVGYRSFDIYSPKYNCFIEMHGRVWHDLKFAPKCLIELVKNNIINDNIKKIWAETQNKKYIVFWDDQIDNWNNQMIEHFNKRGVSYQDAKNSINAKSKS